MSDASMPPFINSTGLISKIFTKIQEAQEPERYTQNFQETVLGYGSGSAKPFIPFLKRLGFLEADGRPTSIYRQFRNADLAGGAMAEAIRIGFKALYQRNEYAHQLTDDKLKNLIVEITGKEKGAGSVVAIAGSFKACKAFANFDAPSISGDDVDAPNSQTSSTSSAYPIDRPSLAPPAMRNVGMAFGYTINLNLPDTDDPKVFNAIFSALKETLLKD